MVDHGRMIFEMARKVNLFHTNADGLATMTALCLFAQESAGDHAELLGFGMERLAEQKIAWVLREQAMNVFRFPALGEELRIITWPTRAERILCYRDYRILDFEGGLVALGTSAWFGLDLEARRPRKADSFFCPDWELVPKPAFVQPLPDLEMPSDPCQAEGRTVRASDVDALGHMNNLRYLDWIEDHLATFGLAGSPVRFLRIRHAREVTASDAVQIRHARSENGDVLLQMLSVGHGREVCLARVALADQE